MQAEYCIPCIIVLSWFERSLSSPRYIHHTNFYSAFFTESELNLVLRTIIARKQQKSGILSNTPIGRQTEQIMPAMLLYRTYKQPNSLFTDIFSVLLLSIVAMHVVCWIGIGYSRIIIAADDRSIMIQVISLRDNRRVRLRCLVQLLTAYCLCGY
jgi:hypothetical protein